MTNGILGRKRAWGFKILDIGNQYGNMNTAESFYPKEMTLEERQKAFLERRIKLGLEKGFDGAHMFMANQQTKDGSYRVIDKELVEAVDDGWKIDTNEDILIITTDTPEVVIGHPVADCPVVMMRDVKKGVTAIGHCSSKMIDRRLPMMIADALLKEYDSKDDDIYAYVSACAKEDSYIYDSYPKWAIEDAVWKNAIIEKEKQYYINLRKAIASQFDERNIKKYIMSGVDTITDENYYSNSAASKGQKEKAGRNFAGAYYKKIG